MEVGRWPVAPEPIPTFVLPPPLRQFYIHELLRAARGSVLHDVLLETVSHVDPDVLSSELKTLAPRDGRQKLQGMGIRDELVFVAPSVLARRPSTFAYYRLLLGVSQKKFYGKETGLGIFRAMEFDDRLPVRAEPLLPELCRTVNVAMSELVTGLHGGLTRVDVEQLPLLMLGAQFDGSWRNRIGQGAIKEVFGAMKEIIESRSISCIDLGESLTLVNPSGRKVTVAIAADPDVVITEEVGGRVIMKVAIEVKGGADQSNAHNRVGEAEKSHQKVKSDAQDFWTVISLSGMDMRVLRRESPTTRRWFDVAEIQKREGPSWELLQDLLALAMGI
jgi:hypothetical protein